jgi:hypothetical protein
VAFVLVPGVAIGSWLGSEFIDAGLGIFAKFFGLNLKINFDADSIFLVICFASIGYVGWRALGKRSSNGGRMMASFLLFFSHCTEFILPVHDAAFCWNGW